jgi:hypothetical protein
MIFLLPLITTFGWSFAKCLGHSVKPHLHSIKALPSFALGKGASAEPYSVKAPLLSVRCWTLGKGFAECHLDTRQR